MHQSFQLIHSDSFMTHCILNMMVVQLLIWIINLIDSSLYDIMILTNNTAVTPQTFTH